MGDRKAIFLNIHYFHVLAGPLEQKFYADTKTGLKKFHTISEGPKIFRLDFCGKWPYKFLKLYEEIWPKFEQVSKKVPTPRTLGSFRWIFHFWSFCFIWGNKARPWFSPAHRYSIVYRIRYIVQYTRYILIRYIVYMIYL